MWPAIPIFFLARHPLRDVTWQDAAIGVAIGYGGIHVLSLTYMGVRTIINRIFRRGAASAGFGGGDAKLLALFAALLGWRVLPYSLFGGAIVGSLITVPLLLLRRESRVDADGKPTTIGQSAYPFGPFLAAGALVYLFFGKTIHAFAMAWLLPTE
jgi:leader peptidase (prepilin peptidase) / N-methyltransferase